VLPVGADAAEGFYRLVDAAYERRSVAVASNLHPAGWDELMSKTLAMATVDRLMHHAHVVMTRRGQLPPRGGYLRQGGAAGLIPRAETVAVRGQKRGHQRAVLMTA
jgi:hypothetical protein